MHSLTNYYISNNFFLLQGCQHISITDIIHQSVAGKDDRKSVTVKILPQLPKQWRVSFEENKNKCEYILPEEDTTD